MPYAARVFVIVGIGVTLYGVSFALWLSAVTARYERRRGRMVVSVIGAILAATTAITLVNVTLYHR